jgi:hypothetical protein
MNIDLNKYSDFVKEVTSQTSNDLTTFIDTLDRLDANYELFDGEMKHGPDVNVPLLITACLGLAAFRINASAMKKFVSKAATNNKFNQLFM